MAQLDWLLVPGTFLDYVFTADSLDVGGILADRHGDASWNKLLQHSTKQQRNVMNVKDNNSTN